MGRINVVTPDNVEEDLQFICNLVNRTRTAVVCGMIEHWAVVLHEQVARGFYAQPVPGASVAGAMAADRAREFDELPASSPTEKP